MYMGNFISSSVISFHINLILLGCGIFYYQFVGFIHTFQISSYLKHKLKYFFQSVLCLVCSGCHTEFLSWDWFTDPPRQRWVFIKLLFQCLFSWFKSKPFLSLIHWVLLHVKCDLCYGHFPPTPPKKGHLVIPILFIDYPSLDTPLNSQMCVYFSSSWKDVDYKQMRKCSLWCCYHIKLHWSQLNIFNTWHGFEYFYSLSIL